MRQLFFMNSLTNKRILIFFFTVYLQAEYLNANSLVQNTQIDKNNSLYLA